MGVEGKNCIEQEIESMFVNELSLKGRAYSNYMALKDVMKKRLELDGNIAVEFHYNPGREASVMAKVDPETLKKRPCFLCPSGLSPEQLTFNWRAQSGEGYFIRVNPFPIFERHYTISADYHTRQEIAGRYPHMLELAEGMPGYVIFYNGPRCGASAPDHFHFQSFPKGHLPIERIAGDESLQEILLRRENMQISELSGYLRGAYLIKGGTKEVMLENFSYLYSLGKMYPNEWEPRMNIISWSNSVPGGAAEFCTVVYFREESRPECFWGHNGETRIYISPATVEMSGVIMTSARATFESVGAAKIGEILKEVSLDGSFADAINNKIREL